MRYMHCFFAIGNMMSASSGGVHFLYFVTIFYVTNTSGEGGVSPNLTNVSNFAVFLLNPSLNIYFMKASKFYVYKREIHLDSL